MDPSMDDPMSDEEEDGDNSRASGGGGGAMDDDVLEGEQIAEEDVYEYGDPDDPLDRVLDVYLAEELENSLYLLQYPMRPADRALNNPHAAKVKVANHMLEVEHAIQQGGKHFDNNAPPQLRQATQKHAGSRVRPATNFAFGVVRNSEFHLTPVHATMQMRPLFDHIDDAKALEIEMDLDDVDEGGAKAAAGRPQQVSFKRKESERATAARKSTYAYKKSVEDAEPWLPLEIYDQNDQLSLNEFSRMFFQSEGQASKQKQATAKEFPAAERYLRGLDYIEEYDENGESFSLDGRGRSRNNAIDLITPGASTYSPVKIPETPLKQLPRDAKILGYLKLAHLVPFSMLLNVTGCSAASALGVLSVDGARAGWLVRGNWAARAEDVWSGGASQAADCLSVVHFLLHRYGAVSRPDLKRRFPDLDPVLLKKLLCNIAELDTIGRRWIPKLKDGISFGLTYRSVVDLEEDRWALQEISLRERLGEEIIAPPTCQVFESFTDILDTMSGAPSTMTYPVRPRLDKAFYSPPAPPSCTTRGRDIVQAGLTAMGQEGVTMTTSGDSFDVKKDEFDGDSKPPGDLRYPSRGDVPMEQEGKGKGREVSEAVSALLKESVSASMVASSSAPAPPPPAKATRHFRPKKRVSPKVAANRKGKTSSGGSIKQEHGSPQERGSCNGAGDNVTPPPHPQPPEITVNDDRLKEPDVFSSSAALAAIAALDSHDMQEGGGRAGAGDAGLVQAPAVEEGVVRVRGPDGNGGMETKETAGEVELDDDDDELDEGGGSRGSQALGGCNGSNETIFSGLAAAKEEPIDAHR